jgi:transposase
VDADIGRCPENPWLRAHYDRLLAAGKRPKVAIVACMRKLLGAIYSVACTGAPLYPTWPRLHMSSR